MAKKNDKENNQSGGPKEYTAENINVLQGLEAVRKRPAMYIGRTGILAPAPTKPEPYVPQADDEEAPDLDQRDPVEW